MNVLIAPDSFKGSLTADVAARAMAAGWRQIFPDATITLLPVADGGEGTAEILAGSTGGTIHSAIVSGPLGKPITAQYALLGDRTTAVLELAQSSGITRITAAERNPRRASTFGFGELIATAISTFRPRHLILSLGGSATNDGGAGALETLGVRFYDAAGTLLSARDGATMLPMIHQADLSSANRIPHCTIEIACDVDNPLLGPRGASAVFGPQKGATPADIAFLEDALHHFADVLTAATGTDVRHIPGSGAAGGTAAGLLWLFPQATLRPGIDIVLDATGFDSAVRDADILLTGEGRLDQQTLGGKVIAGLIRRARQVNPGVFIGAIAGSVAPELDNAALDTLGLDAVLPLVPGPIPLPDAIANAETYLATATSRAARWYRRS